MTKRTSRQDAPPQVEAMGYATGVRVKSSIDMGHVAPGTIGKITQVLPETGAFVVQFDGASHDTLVAPTQVQAIGYALGDHVKCTINIGAVPAGTTGTVKKLVPAADAYGVEFDGYMGQLAMVPNVFLVPT